jgi:nucleoside-diphosphate-sugar epimerase
MPAGLIVGMGYVGRPLARQWLAAGWEVWATTRHARRFAELSALGVRPVAWNVLADSSAALPQVDAVAYAVGHDRSQGVPMRDIYVGGLARTLAALPGNPRIVYVSSTGVYGDAHGGWVDEDTPPAPIDEAGAVCLEAEGLLAGRRGAVIMRSAGIYGPGRMIGAEGLRFGRPVAGDPEGWLNLIHVADLAAAIRAATEVDQPPALLCAADGQPVRRRDFYTHAAELLGAPLPTFDPSSARRRRGDRRIRNHRLLAALGLTLRHPTYREGLPSCLE